MKFIERENIDIEKWDSLVKSSNGLAFSLSHYLDAVAENWCVYVDGNYTKGIAIPYAVRLGRSSVYTPLFLRCLEWFGGESPKKLVEILSSNFRKGDLILRANGCQSAENLIYQEIYSGTEIHFNDLAKRMIRKFERSNYSISEVESSTEIVRIIEEELPKKISSVNKESIHSLVKLIESFQNLGKMRMMEVRLNGDCMGGAFFIDHGDRVIYLKSAFRAEAKKNGAMYALMNLEIQNAIDTNKTFDFGGSRIEGVRRFNKNLGGEDRAYSCLKWDAMPFWYKGAKTLRDKLKKR